jgi:transposase
MADKKSPRTPLTLSPEALFRYQIVSAVKAREFSGQGTDAAVREVAAQHHLTLAGEHKTVAVRSIYRWIAEFDRDGTDGIEMARPERTISLTLPQLTVPLLRLLRQTGLT